MGIHNGHLEVAKSVEEVRVEVFQPLELHGLYCPEIAAIGVFGSHTRKSGE